MLRRLHPAPLLLAALVLLLLPPSTPTTSSSSSSPILAPSLSQKTSPASSSSSLSEEPPQEEDEDKEWTWHLLSFLDADPYVDRSLFDYILDWRAPSAANPANVARTLTGFQWPERARTSERQVRLLFLGDLTPHKQFGADLSVSRRLRRELGDADLVVINLEACVRSEPSSNAGKRLIFEYETDKLKKLLLRLVSHSDAEEAPPEDVQRTRLSRVVLNIANNHAYDSSTSAPSVTVKELQQMGVQVVGDAVEGKGADTSVDPKSIIKVVDVDGGRLKVGIVGWTELLNSPSRFFKRSVGLNRVSQLTATVKKGVSIDVNIRTERTIELLERADIPGMRASGEVDFVVASPHWDYENNFFPHHKTVAYAERLFKAGVQLIVGHGPHVVQPIGVADANGHVAAPGPITPPLREAQGLVAYSVGNFIPSGQSSGATACGMMLEVNVFPRVSASESSEGHDAAFASYEAHSVMFAGDRIEVDSTPRDSNHPARSWGPDMTTMYKKCSNVFELTFSEQRRSHEIANASLTGVDVTKLWAEYDKCRATTVMKPERTLEVTFGLIENVIEMFGRNAARKMLSKVRPFILSDYSLARAKYKIEKPYAKVAAQDAKEALALLLCGEDNRFCTSLDIYGGIYMRALSDGALMTWRSLTLALKRGQLPSFVRLVHRYGLLAEYSVADWVFSLSKCVGVLQNKIEPMVAELQKQITALHALFVESEDNFFKSRAMLEKNAESGNKQAQDEIARADETHRRHMAQIRATLEIAYAAQNTLQSALGKQLRARAERIAEMERARIEKEEKKTSGLFSSVGKFVSNIFGRLKRGDRVTSKGATSRDKEGRLARA